jgi:hypothetical protein
MMNADQLRIAPQTVGARLSLAKPRKYAHSTPPAIR